MIWFYIITFVNRFFSAVFSAFSIPRVEVLPLGMDEALSTGFGYFHYFMEIYPPIAIIFQAVMFYLGFKVIMLILKNIPIIRINTN